VVVGSATGPRALRMTKRRKKIKAESSSREREKKNDDRRGVETPGACRARGGGECFVASVFFEIVATRSLAAHITTTEERKKKTAKKKVSFFWGGKKKSRKKDRNHYILFFLFSHCFCFPVF